MKRNDAAFKWPHLHILMFSLFCCFDNVRDEIHSNLAGASCSADDFLDPSELYYSVAVPSFAIARALVIKTNIEYSGITEGEKSRWYNSYRLRTWILQTVVASKYCVRLLSVLTKRVDDVRDFPDNFPENNPLFKPENINVVYMTESEDQYMIAECGFVNQNKLTFNLSAKSFIFLKDSKFCFDKSLKGPHLFLRMLPLMAPYIQFSDNAPFNLVYSPFMREEELMEWTDDLAEEMEIIPYKSGFWGPTFKSTHIDPDQEYNFKLVDEICPLFCLDRLLDLENSMFRLITIHSVAYLDALYGFMSLSSENWSSILEEKLKESLGLQSDIKGESDDSKDPTYYPSKRGTTKKRVVRKKKASVGSPKKGSKTKELSIAEKVNNELPRFNPSLKPFFLPNRRLSISSVIDNKTKEEIKSLLQWFQGLDTSMQPLVNFCFNMNDLVRQEYEKSCEEILAKDLESVF